MLHILLGDSRADTDSVFKAGDTDKPLLWVVPKKARAGDSVLFYLPKPHGFVARGSVDSEAQPNTHRTGRYTAMVGDIQLLASSVPLAFIRDNHKTWKWPTYPRGYATIDGATEKRLNELLDGYQDTVAEPLTEGTPKTGSVTTYERNPVARQECIEHYGCTCFACGFSFGETYGETAVAIFTFTTWKTLRVEAGSTQSIRSKICDRSAQTAT